MKKIFSKKNVIVHKCVQCSLKAQLSDKDKIKKKTISEDVKKTE